jgi:hypothetical protein
MEEYSYATDSESGTIQAADFAEACQQLRDMLPPTAVADGAWGWVENTDGSRFLNQRENNDYNLLRRIALRPVQSGD